jgi:hypothetical protein
VDAKLFAVVFSMFHAFFPYLEENLVSLSSLFETTGDGFNLLFGSCFDGVSLLQSS